MPREPEANTKGGGQRGGPRRWDGSGPRPARHIPWPEVCFALYMATKSLKFVLLAAVQTPPVEFNRTPENDGHGAQALCPRYRQL